MRNRSDPNCVKSACIRSYSGLHFPAFGLNTERYSVSLRIQSECGKMRTKITPNTDTFHAVPTTEPCGMPERIFQDEHWPLSITLCFFGYPGCFPKVWINYLLLHKVLILIIDTLSKAFDMPWNIALTSVSGL